MVERGGAEKKNCGAGGEMGLGWSVWGWGESNSSNIVHYNKSYITL